MMPVAMWLPATILASLSILGILLAALRKYGNERVERDRLLQTIAGHTKQLTANDGSHIADVVRRTEAITLDNAEKIKGFSDKWDEQQIALKAALEVQQAKVAADLKTHRGEVATEFGAVWRELATRDIHKSVDQLTEAADRAEAATPPRIEN